MTGLKYGILASGRLGAVCTEELIKSKSINFVLTDKHSLDIIDICDKFKIPVFAGNPRQERTKEFLKEFQTDVLLSVNYLFIIEKDIINHPKKYAINLHGSLLPKYRGRTPHVWAIINNEKQTGITAHLISDQCDAGDILYQELIQIASEDTGASILERFKHRYPFIINNIIDIIETNSVKLVKQDSSKATFFGKRTPLDGIINWNWQREQIYNWVRAQSRPYPGAFTFYQGRKITIHRIEYDDLGFHHSDINGTILNSEQAIVKASNGAVKLVDFEKEEDLTFQTGEIFHGRY